MPTVGGQLAQLGERGGFVASAAAFVAADAKLAGAALSLALVRPWSQRLPQRPLITVAAATAALLTLYGAALVLAGALALAGVFGPVHNPTPLRWHVLVWDLWFLIWGLLLGAAVVQRRRQRSR